MEDYTKLKIAYDNIYEEYKKIKNGEKLIELQRNILLIKFKVQMI